MVEICGYVSQKNTEKGPKQERKKGLKKGVLGLRFLKNLSVVGRSQGQKEPAVPPALTF